MLVASKKEMGKLSTSDQPTVFATRSSSDPGGLFIGTLQEFRMWKVARTEEDINLWKHHLLPTKPSNSKLIGLWSGEPGPPSEAYDYLLGEGFSQDEVFLLYFAYWYSRLYNQQAKSILTDKARKYYSEHIRWVLFVRAQDGYFALYFPEFAEGMNPDMVDESGMQPGREVMILDQREKTVTELIQSWTGNYLKVLFPPLGKSMREPWKLPDDISDASDENISPSLRKYEVDLPKLTISAAVNVEDGIISNIRPGRIRAFSPLIQESDGLFERQFTWVFADFWFGEISRNVTHLPNTQHFLSADLQALQWLVDLGLPPQESVDDGPDKAIIAMKRLLHDFEELLDRPFVDEVRDIQPFLADRRNWILLSPNPKQVWSQKMLGNKYKVDYIVRESDDSYTAIEIESPNFPLFTKSLNPHHKLTHAEQQARDYCGYVDLNCDSVEREEALPGIFRPRGVIVIGRRRSLSPEALRKLVARNRDNERYTVMVYDDLIDRVRSIIKSIEAVIHP